MNAFIGLLSRIYLDDLFEDFGFFIILAAIYNLVAIILVCKKFSAAAKAKGDPDSAIGVKCFFFGLPYMLAVIAMPDRGGYENQSSDHYESVEAAMSKGLSTWKCPVCGRENKNSSGVCKCGTQKPNVQRTR